MKFIWAGGEYINTRFIRRLYTERRYPENAYDEEERRSLAATWVFAEIDGEDTLATLQVFDADIDAQKFLDKLVNEINGEIISANACVQEDDVLEDFKKKHNKRRR